MFIVPRKVRYVVMLGLMISGFLMFVHIAVSRSFTIGYDNIRFDVEETPSPPTIAQQLKQILNCRDSPLIWEKLQYGNYWLIKNFIRGDISRNIGCSESITYTTNGDYTFFSTLPTVVERWMGPVSFAIFAPGYDFEKAMESINYARHCLPESPLIRKYVTFHIYFPNEHMPQSLPLNEAEALQWTTDCQMFEEPPYENVNRSEMYKTAKGLMYPINVGRNIARKAANTNFIFACDIELYPSRGVIDQFMEMVARNASGILGDPDDLRVFPLPVFELSEDAVIPDNKTQLIRLLKTKKAIPFHYYRCKVCHLVPQQDQWVKANDTTELSLFSMTKRQNKFIYWEPFYISDNREPMFDERVTWEGQSNKRIQGYAMCLMDYEYHILHPAFIVHNPGIKKVDPKSPRLKFVPAMNKLIRTKIKPEYIKLYGNNSKCGV